MLVIRERRAPPGTKKAGAISAVPSSSLPPVFPWKGAVQLQIVDAATLAELRSGGASLEGKLLVVCSSLGEVRQVGVIAGELSSVVRAVVAPFIPSGWVSVFSGCGIAALQADSETLASVRALGPNAEISLPALAHWKESGATIVEAGGSELPLTWLAVGIERVWTGAGTARLAPSSPKGSRKA